MLSDKIYRLLETKIDVLRKEERLEKDAERLKTLDEVFDHNTLLTLYKLISDQTIDTIDFPISTGKEANVFIGTTINGDDVALKIYRVSTATFRTFARYIEGDPRFKHQSRDHRRMVYTWAKKEFKNLKRIEACGVRVPKPFLQRNNVLIMEYIGDEYTPAPILKDIKVRAPYHKLKLVLEWIRKMYVDARFVHGDLSEYNILVSNDELVLIDVAQGVLLDHPLAEELLERDVNNICKYFNRLGVGKRIVPEKVIADIRKEGRL